MISLAVLLSALSILLLAYLIRGSRQLGTKLSKLQSSNIKNFKEIEQMLTAQARSAKHSEQLLYLPYIQGQNPDWKFEVSVTSHPVRFDALAIALTALRTQTLQPQAINVFIAEADLAALPDSVKQL